MNSGTIFFKYILRNASLFSPQNRETQSNPMLAYEQYYSEQAKL